MPPGIELVLETAKLAALAILRNGGETYRAEEAVVRLGASVGMCETEVLALPTGIIITLSDGLQRQTTTCRVHKRVVHITAVDQANRIVRQVIAGDIGWHTGRDALKTLLSAPPTPKWVPILSAAFGSGFFTLLFGGGWFEFVVALCCGAVVRAGLLMIQRVAIQPFLAGLLGGMGTALFSIGATSIFGMGNLEALMTGTIMPMLPGLAMTNAIRDTMRGDLVSGVARGAEALLIAVALGAGAAAVMRGAVLIGGLMS